VTGEAADVGGLAGHVASLQRSVGNAATTAMVQRWPDWLDEKEGGDPAGMGGAMGGAMGGPTEGAAAGAREGDMSTDPLAGGLFGSAGGMDNGLLEEEPVPATGGF